MHHRSGIRSKQRQDIETLIELEEACMVKAEGSRAPNQCQSGEAECGGGRRRNSVELEYE